MSWQTGKSWLGLSGETVLLAAVLVAEPAGVALPELSTVVETAALEETKVVGKATSTVVGFPSLRVLTIRAAVGWLDEEDVVESLLTNGPAEAPRMVPDMAKNVARREVTRIVDKEGWECSGVAVNSESNGRDRLALAQNAVRAKKAGSRKRVTAEEEREEREALDQ